MLQFLGTGFTAYLKIQAAWERGGLIPDRDPQVWRTDANGCAVRRSAYEDPASLYGWRVGRHGLPEALDGEALADLRPKRQAAH